MERNNESLNGRKPAVIEQEMEFITSKNLQTPNGKTALQVKPEVDLEAEEATLPPPQKKQKRQRPMGLILAALGVGAIAAGSFGYRWWQYASTHEETDNASVAGHVHQISSRINGTVADVLVDDNQQVQKGQLLVKLDPRDYENKEQQAQAALETARRQAKAAQSNINLASQNAQANTTQARGNIESAIAAVSTAQAAVKEARAGIPAAQAELAQAEANLQKTQADYNRYNSLYEQGVISRQQLDTSRADYQVALAQRNAAQQGVAQAQAKLAQAQESVTRAQAQLAASRGGLQQAQASGVQTQVNRSQYEAAQAAIA
jgi:membrane fusion protein (multidrug efflux system)